MFVFSDEGGDLNDAYVVTYSVPRSETTSPRVAKKDGNLEASGRAMVTQGGNGAIKATLTFDGEGKLIGFNEESQIRPGPRPICQATKLLDADPIVRKMAEQDLLYMGLAARARPA